MHAIILQQHLLHLSLLTSISINFNIIMNINVSPDVYWNDCTTLPAIRGEIKSRIEDFRVFEMSNHDSFIDPTRVSTVFRPVRDDDCIIVQQTGRSNAGVTPLATADVAAYMESASFLPGISALNMWVHQPGLTATYTGEQKIVFAAPEITNRRLVYQYLKTHFPFCKAEKNTDGGSEEGYVVSADTSLLPLLAVGLPLADIINIYLYISRGPLTEDAAKGIAVGRGLDRTCRTAVYKCISKICPLLDSKTLDDKETGVIYININKCTIEQ